MDLVGTTLDLDVDGSSTGEALFSCEAIGDHVHGFDGFQRRHIGGDVGQPCLLAGRTVNADVVTRSGRTVHVGCQSAGGVGGHGVGILGRAETRDGNQDVLVVATNRHRNVR